MAATFEKGLMMHFRRSVLTAVVAGSLISGLGVSPALAASPSISLGYSGVPSATTAGDVGTTSADVRPVLPSEPASPTTPVPETRKGLASVIIAAIKRVPGLFSSLGRAIKKGYSAFNAAWRKVPAPIRFLAGDLSVSTIYDLLKGFF